MMPAKPDLTEEVIKKATCDQCYEEYPADKMGHICPCGGVIVDPKKLPNF